MKFKTMFAVTAVMVTGLSVWAQEQKPPTAPAPPATAPLATPAETVPAPASAPTTENAPAAVPSQTASPAPATQAPSATSGVAPASDAANRYIISADDSLQITVWKEPSFSGTVPVRPDGMISMALVGDLPAAGFTPMRLSTDIAARLKKYINDPSVTVTVLAVKPKQVFLLGEVAHIGPIAITPEMTPLQAIAAAGGLTPYAKSKSIYILRGEAGHQKKILYNYKKAIKSGDEQGVSLVPGDTIVVP